MTDWHEADERFEKFRRDEDHAMPTGSESRKKAARKETYRSRRATKRVAKAVSGMRNRRRRRIN